MTDFKGLVPCISHDDADAALARYSRVFGFEETGRWLDAHGRVQNAEMRVGNTEPWVDGGGRRQDQDPRPAWSGVWVDDVDAMYERVRGLGVECESPVIREFGVRMLTVPDGMGYLWGFIKHV